MPNVQKAWQVFIQNKRSESSAAALKMYEETMVSVQEVLPCTNNEVYQYHRKAWDQTLKVFKCEADGISAVNTDQYLKEVTVNDSLINALN